MTIILFYCLFWGTSLTIAALIAWPRRFKGNAGQGLKMDRRVTTRTRGCPPFGTRDAIMKRILESRLDE